MIESEKQAEWLDFLVNFMSLLSWTISLISRAVTNARLLYPLKTVRTRKWKFMLKQEALWKERDSRWAVSYFWHGITFCFKAWFALHWNGGRVLGGQVYLEVRVSRNLLSALFWSSKSSIKPQDHCSELVSLEKAWPGVSFSFASTLGDSWEAM